MEAIISDPNPVRVKRKTLQTVLEQCQRALELINASSDDDEDDVSDSNDEPLPSTRPDPEADQLCDLLKSRLECPDFLEKLECAQASVYQNTVEEGNSWDLISENDLWEGDDSEDEDYVLVRQDDIVDGIACFMAAYLLSLKKTKIACNIVFEWDCGGIARSLKFAYLFVIPKMGIVCAIICVSVSA
ncbi:hypothetical protein TSUD_244440 [Trifolium subterraneum]|uniref:Uncharacterized protein n=1 Tax=Trifolium subterraneum TaxID=3900 RepID=A0A2Z6P3H9_TRISU|nr:hypothetical protein TSUD_244440 [Trifolium subterraneum]